MFLLEADVTDVVDQVEQSADILKKTLNDLTSWALGKAGSIILALLCLAIGLKLVKLVVKIIRKSFNRHGLDPSVATFLLSLIHIVLNVLVMITAATMVGFQMASFITLLGTAGLAVGMALQGSLSNLAGGVLILMLKPFSVGDYIQEKGTGQEGTVTAIDIFYTRLRTVDNKMVVVPNGNLSATSIVNFSKNETRRLDLTIGVAYDSDITKVKEVLGQAILADPHVLKDQPIDIFIESFDDSAVTMGMHCWILGKDYWDAKWNIQTLLKQYLDQAHIEIPFPQVDVHTK